jgi:hypothetical protein
MDNRDSDFTLDSVLQQPARPNLAEHIDWGTSHGNNIAILVLLAGILWSLHHVVTAEQLQNVDL